jgi:hypothetical protein
MNRRTGWILLLVLNALAYCVLGFYQTSMAGSPIGSPPFANTSESRLEMVEQLKEIKDLLKEQNALLRSGDVKVIVTELPKGSRLVPGEAVPSTTTDPTAPAPAEQESK